VDDSLVAGNKSRVTEAKGQMMKEFDCDEVSVLTE
jgi:hypothetical protein